MRNKFKKRKSTARPTRYTGHATGGGSYGGDRDPALPSPPRTPRTPPEKGFLDSEGRFSMSMLDRPSMMSDRDNPFGPMSFELPRRPGR